MECKECGNDEIEEFDVGVSGLLGTPDTKLILTCLSCDFVRELTEEDKKEFKENGL